MRKQIQALVTYLALVGLSSPLLQCAAFQPQSLQSCRQDLGSSVKLTQPPIRSFQSAVVVKASSSSTTTTTKADNDDNTNNKRQKIIKSLKRVAQRVRRAKGIVTTLALTLAISSVFASGAAVADTSKIKNPVQSSSTQTLKYYPVSRLNVPSGQLLLAQPKADPRLKKVSPVNTPVSEKASKSSLFKHRLGKREKIVIGVLASLLIIVIVSNLATSVESYNFGPGVTTGSITVAVDVKDRQSSTSLLNRLHALASKADTASLKGTQALVADVALELIKQERSILSATTSTMHYNEMEQGNREFESRSSNDRNKYKIEAVNKVQDTSKSTASNPPTKTNMTVAVVTINFAIKGNKTELPIIRYRKDVVDALNTIIQDGKDRDGLLAAEILFAPDQSNGEALDIKDLRLDYPTLNAV